MQTGECRFTFEYNEPCRAVAFSLGEQLAAITNDPFIQAPGCIRIVRIAQDPKEQSAEEVLKIGGSTKRFTRITFHELNRKLMTSGEDGFVRLWDTEVTPDLACRSACPACVMHHVTRHALWSGQIHRAEALHGWGPI